MSTSAQAIANRENSLHSTGPRTQSGKNTSKYNATKHGLTGKQIVIAGEDPVEFEDLIAGLFELHAPKNEHESMLVQQIAASWWRLHRAYRTERSIVEQLGEEAIFMDDAASKKYRNFTRHLNAIERQWRSATNELKQIQKLRDRPQAPKLTMEEWVHSKTGFVLSPLDSERAKTSRATESAAEIIPRT
jgi:hypothetical protein